MKKLIIIIFFIVFCSAQNIYAENISDSYEHFNSESQKFNAYSISVDDIKESKNLSDIVNHGLRLLFKEICDMLFPMLKLLVILILSAIASMINDDGNGYIRIINIATYIISFFMITSQFRVFYNLYIDVAGELVSYINTSLNMHYILLSATGYGYMSVFVKGTLLAFINVLNNIFFKYLSPVIYMCVIIIIANGVINSKEVSRFIDSVKKFLKYSISIFLLVFSFLMMFIGYSTYIKDNLMIKAAKHASATFVPLVGNFLSDAMNNILYSSVLIKWNVGYISVLTIIIICIVPIIKFFVFTVILKTISFAASFLQQNNHISEVLDKLADVSILLTSLIIVISVLFIVISGMLMNIGG